MASWEFQTCLLCHCPQIMKLTIYGITPKLHDIIVETIGLSIKKHQDWFNQNNPLICKLLLKNKSHQKAINTLKSAFTRLNFHILEADINSQSGTSMTGGETKLQKFKTMLIQTTSKAFINQVDLRSKINEVCSAKV